MFYKIEEKHFSEEGVPNVYRYDLQNLLCEETYGVCTCGARFLMKREVGELGTIKLTTNFHKKYERCPQCGDLFGSWTASPKCFCGEKLTMTGTDFSLGGCVLQAMVDEPNGGLTIIKEHLPPISEKCLDPQFTRYEVKIAAIPIPHVERIMIDRREVSITKKNLASALSNLSIAPSRAHEGVSVQQALEWVAHEFATTAPLKAATMLFDYPVLYTVFQKIKRGQSDISYYAIDAIKEGLVKKGERSERKAFGLPRAVYDIFPGKVSVLAAKWCVKEFGPELAATAIEDSVKLSFGGNSLQDKTFMQFAELYCRLKTAERQRLMQYLTHDVAVYQGIDEPFTALSILLDYRKMCLDMEVAPVLCPKSLKLQHDMAARNHRLCLDEIQKRQFTEAVAKDDYGRLAWTSANGQWAVVIPEKPDDLVEEGRKQSHCVGSYITYVSEGAYRICFLRQTADLEKPVLTLTVDKKDCCIFYKGFDNRNATEDEKNTLKQWAKARKLTLSENG